MDRYSKPIEIAVMVARQRRDSFTKPPFLNKNEYSVTFGGPW
jgi:hypothetical protein